MAASGVSVRAFSSLKPPTTAENEHIHAMYSQSMTSLATPIFKQAMRKSIGLKIRGPLIVLTASCLCHYFLKSVPLTALAATISAMFVPLLVWLFAWAQMAQAVQKADDLESIEAFYASDGAKFGTSARFWVAESKDHGGIIGCLAMKRTPPKKTTDKATDEAELRFLAVHHSSTDWEDSIELLLQAAVKHARTSGFKALSGTVVTGQEFLESCYLQQGFKQGDVRKSNAWFTAKLLKLSLKK